MDVVESAEVIGDGFVAHAMRVSLRRGGIVPRGAVDVSSGVFKSPFICRDPDVIVDVHLACAQFRDWFYLGPQSKFFSAECDDWDRWGRMLAAIGELRGKRLADSLPLTVPSHADVLAEVANGAVLPVIDLVWRPVAERASSVRRPRRRQPAG